MKIKAMGYEKPTANAISLNSITATVRSKGVACPKFLMPVRNQVTITVKYKREKAKENTSAHKIFTVQ